MTTLFTIVLIVLLFVTAWVIRRGYNSWEHVFDFTDTEGETWGGIYVQGGLREVYAADSDTPGSVSLTIDGEEVPVILVNTRAERESLLTFRSFVVMC
jgi:hypothetical protein